MRGPLSVACRRRDVRQKLDYGNCCFLYNALGIADEAPRCVQQFLVCLYVWMMGEQLSPANTRTRLHEGSKCPVIFASTFACYPQVLEGLGGKSGGYNADICTCTCHREPPERLRSISGLPCMRENGSAEHLWFISFWKVSFWRKNQIKTNSLVTLHISVRNWNLTFSGIK